MNVNVLRLDHRLKRDKRITTHVCLTARAFGASKIYLAGEEDHRLMENVRDIVNRWGGDFEVEYIEHYMQLIMNWRDNGGKIVHLTMYGSQAHEVVDEIRDSGDDILIIVGGSKVPTKIYENADWNVSVTTQPHSEVSSLGVFQHLLMDGKEFDLEFDNPVFEVIPTAHGKNVNVHKENKKG
ncbi:tRNA 2'-O-methylase [Methanobrevibacter woesei]|uniref:tRNA (cytidine(56)-2'-O)-methyltransferase n=2 Tax=Methanobrevibacter woesei TaxID=190976 RepID=A0A2U1S7B0_9EURY|nr:tRNA 2'-O-methylase [Methanobrevibacter woesei]